MKRFKKTFMMMICIALVAAFMPVAAANAGEITTVTLGPNLTPNDLVKKLLGQGVTVSNITLTGAHVAAGTFAGGKNILGFDEGIILSSGHIENVIGPNKSPSTSWWNWAQYFPGDSDLDALIPSYQTYEALVLEFDFVPAGNTIYFEYVFGSEEYNEWVGSQFNDVFGFFINGENQALIPGTITPVSINNVNAGNAIYACGPTHPEYYIDNDYWGGKAFLNTEMDGLTVVLGVTAKVNPNETNHIKLAIADAGDFVYDSWVVIKAESFVSVPELYLSPINAAGQAGAEHFLTAMATLDGVVQQGVSVDFLVTDGPNQGLKGSSVTDAAGNAQWSYMGTGGQGTDTVEAAAVIGGTNKLSNKAYVEWETPDNLPPHANAGPAQTVEANTAGGALVSFDGSGSYDDGPLLPDDYQWSWTENGMAKTAQGVNPKVKLPLGDTTVNLTVSDGQFSDTDTVVITIEDTTAPELMVACVESTNPRGNNTPGKNRGKNGKVKKNQNPDGFYELTLKATDVYDTEVATYVGVASDPYLFVIEPGVKVIKFTEDADTPPEMKKMGSISKNGRAVAVEFHIILPGDPLISAVDGSGNVSSSETCFVPSPPM